MNKILTKKIKKILESFILIFVVATFYNPTFAGEEITLSTYYPSPYGEYIEMQVKRSLIVGEFSPSEKKEGEVWVKEGIIFNPLEYVPECNTDCQGKMYYNNIDDKFYYCSSTGWKKLGGD